MMAMNGFTLGFFPKQVKSAEVLKVIAQASQPEVKLAEEKPAREDRHDFEPSTLALNAYRFF